MMCMYFTMLQWLTIQSYRGVKQVLAEVDSPLSLEYMQRLKWYNEQQKKKLQTISSHITSRNSSYLAAVGTSSTMPSNTGKDKDI
jgi:hypothetical protein